MFKKIFVFTTLFVFIISTCLISAQNSNRNDIDEVRKEIRELQQSLENNPILKDPLTHKEKYLLLLHFIGECWGDYTLSTESYDKANEGDLLPLIASILSFKQDYNVIPGELPHIIPNGLRESFGLFWTDSSPSDYPEVYRDLRANFDIHKNDTTKKWELIDRGEYSKLRKSLLEFTGMTIWIPRPVVRDKGYSIIVKNFSNFERATIEFIDLENLIIVIKKANGELINWKPHSATRINEIVMKHVSEQIENIFWFKRPEDVFPGWSNEVWNTIKNEEIMIGFNEKQVLLSWGVPDKKNTYTHSRGTLEQWVYGSIIDGAVDFVYFKNGIVESMSSHE